MLLRYIALHGQPQTDEDWKKYEDWKANQLQLPECHMADPEGSPVESCADCPGRPDCPKNRRA